MRAVAVIPGQPDSAHLREVPEPRLSDVPDGLGVLVQVLRVGLDGTDREINAAEYGKAPPDADFLILGHESLGRVVEVGPAVTGLRPGQLVVSRVRRAGSSLYDRLGMPDFTTDDEYAEHGISGVHGFLTERYVESPEYLVPVPERLRDVGVLLEPTSIVVKGVRQAFEIQRRLKVWHPARAAVLGVGTIGLLATLLLRNRGLDVVGAGLERPPYLNADLVAAVGGVYASTADGGLEGLAADGRFDLVFEATGFSPLAFEAMRSLLAKNGVIVLSSVTGGDRRAELPVDAINLDLVLGNKVAVGTVNANRQHFEEGVRELAVTEARYPGWLERLLTHRVAGLDAWQDALAALEAKDAIKVCVAVAD